MNMLKFRQCSQREKRILVIFSLFYFFINILYYILMQMSYKFLLCKQLYFGGFLGGSIVKKKKKILHQQRRLRRHGFKETWVLSLGLEDPLEEEMVTHSNILEGKIQSTEKAGGLQCMRSQSVGQDWQLSTHTHRKFYLQAKSLFASNFLIHDSRKQIISMKLT